MFLTAREALLTHNQSLLRLRLVGANAKPRVVGLKRLPGKVSYLVGDDPSHWQTGIPLFGSVRLERVYPGIDLVWHGRRDRLEYDFVIAPGIDPAQIAVSFPSARVSLDRAGGLILRVPGTTLRQPRPRAFQGQRQIDVRYLLGADSRVSFQIARYDRTKPLLIDPELIYSTYLGGDSTDFGNGIAVDGAGNAYVAGTSSSADHKGGNVFVAKLNATGSAPAYITYFGGSNPDYGTAIAIDGAGSAYVTGATDSFDFPVTADAFQTEVRGSSAFVTKLNPSGSIAYSTYLGGDFEDSGSAIAVDGAGNAYVAGSTDSRDFSTTAGALQGTFGGPAELGVLANKDGFVAKLSRDGSTLAYATYLGGRDYDVVTGIAVDSAGSAYVTGHSGSVSAGTMPAGDFPATAGAIQTSFRGGFWDGFVAKLTPTGSALLYSTYLGGSSDDVGSGIAVDGGGSAYVTGTTGSADFPVTAVALRKERESGVPSAPAASDAEAFVAKLNGSGSALSYATYLGGGNREAGAGIAVDGAGGAYVTGWTLSDDFPTTVRPAQRWRGGLEDVFVARLNSTGSALTYSTYLGGRHTDQGAAIAVDGAGVAYVTGHTNFDPLGSTSSGDFPTTAGVIQPAFGGFSDGFVVALPSFDVAPACSPAWLMIGTRGSGQQLNLTQALGPPVAAFLSRLKQSVFRHDPRLSASDVQIVANPYPAISVPRAILTGGIRRDREKGTVVPRTYMRSRGVGIGWLRRKIDVALGACATTKIVLGGFSQGADVTATVYQNLPPAQRARASPPSRSSVTHATTLAPSPLVRRTSSGASRGVRVGTGSWVPARSSRSTREAVFSPTAINTIRSAKAWRRPAW